MEYLKKYNLTEEDIDEILDCITDSEYKEMVFKQENVEEVLRYFINKGITNIKDIIKHKNYLLYNDIEYLNDVFNKKDNNIIKLINEDIINFDLIGL